MPQPQEEKGAGFTPGPWVEGDCAQGSAVRGAATELVAVIPDPQKWRAGVCDAAEREANARLMAAAPTLAEDGAFLVARIDELDWSDPQQLERDWHGHIVPALARFRAAITLATGAQS